MTKTDNKVAVLGIPSAAGNVFRQVCSLAVAVLVTAGGFAPAPAAAQPTLSVGDLVQTEEDGAVNVRFTVTLSGPSSLPVTVGFSTAAGRPRPAATTMRGPAKLCLFPHPVQPRPRPSSSPSMGM